MLFIYHTKHSNGLHNTLFSDDEIEVKSLYILKRDSTPDIKTSKHKIDILQWPNNNKSPLNTL